MLEHARQVTAAEQLDDVRYELGDAQVYRFDPAGFDGRLQWQHRHPRCHPTAFGERRLSPPEHGTSERGERAREDSNL
jgi:hypothetical protein